GGFDFGALAPERARHAVEVGLPLGALQLLGSHGVSRSLADDMIRKRGRTKTRRRAGAWPVRADATKATSAKPFPARCAAATVRGAGRTRSAEGPTRRCCSGRD